MKHEEDLHVWYEVEVTRLEKTDRLDMSEATPSCLGDIGQDARETESTRKEKNLREAKDRVDGHCDGRK